MPTTTVPGGTCLKQSACYLSTPEHVRSFVGRFIYIYTDKGTLSLTDDSLQFVGKNGVPATLPLSSILATSIGEYSRWAKPSGLDHIAVRYLDGKTERIILLTPMRSPWVPTWETNKIVAEWADALEAARTKHAA